MSSELSAASTIDEWLRDEQGHAALARLLESAGSSVDSLEGARSMTLRELVPLSGGTLTREVVADLVRSVGGDADRADDTDGIASGDAHRSEWTERISAGRFAGKTVIVTGAGSGIGLATAARVAREGGRVIAADVSAERLDALVREHPEQKIVAVAGDISQGEDVRRIVEAAGERVHGLANVAGIMDNMTPWHEVTDDVWERIIRINVTGTFLLTRAVIPLMLDAREGSIVNIASEAALRGSSAGFAYTTSKHAVVGMTRSAAFMYGPSGIRVNCVAPGSTITNIQASFDSALGRERILPVLALAPTPVEAARVAASITFLLSDDGINLNGALLPSDAGQSVM